MIFYYLRNKLFFLCHLNYLSRNTTYIKKNWYFSGRKSSLYVRKLSLFVCITQQLIYLQVIVFSVKETIGLLKDWVLWNFRCEKKKVIAIIFHIVNFFVVLGCRSFFFSWYRSFPHKFLYCVIDFIFHLFFVYYLLNIFYYKILGEIKNSLIRYPSLDQVVV